MVNQSKQNQLKSILDFMQKGDNFAFIKFEKTTHTALEGLRKKLKKQNSKIKVVKNTILKKAVNKLVAEKKEAHLKELQKNVKTIQENTALLSLGDDWSFGLKTLNEFAKTDKTISLRLGCLDKTIYNQVQMIRIASLPSKTELYGKMLGSMKSPIAHITSALKYNMQKLAYILNAKSKQI